MQGLLLSSQADILPSDSSARAGPSHPFPRAWDVPDWDSLFLIALAKPQLEICHAKLKTRVCMYMHSGDMKRAETPNELLRCMPILGDVHGMVGPLGAPSATFLSFSHSVHWVWVHLPGLCCSQADARGFCMEY